LLTGERGQYEIAQFSFYYPNKKVTLDNGTYIIKYEDGGPTSGEYVIGLNSAKFRLDTMQNFANDGLMIPEQVWDSFNIPKNVDKQFVPELKFGEGTGSATPLAWSMAQFIRLAVNLKARRNLDTPKVVYDRYVLGKKDFVADADFDENPFEFAEVDTRCFGDKPLYKKDCSYSWTVISGKLKNPTIRPCRIDGFFSGCGLPNQMHACFAYQGEYKNLEIAGEFTDWKPIALKLKKKNDGYEAQCFNFDKSARVEYKLIVDGKSITDPLNPNKVSDGKGGENSFFTMPDYKPGKNQ
jgi:hypothetical protein